MTRPVWSAQPISAQQQAVEYVSQEARSVAGAALTEALEALANLGRASMAGVPTAREEQILAIFRDGGHAACLARRPGHMAQLYTGRSDALGGKVRVTTLWRLVERGLVREKIEGPHKVWELEVT